MRDQIIEIIKQTPCFSDLKDYLFQINLNPIKPCKECCQEIGAKVFELVASQQVVEADACKCDPAQVGFVNTLQGPLCNCCGRPRTA